MRNKLKGDEEDKTYSLTSITNRYCSSTIFELDNATVSSSVSQITPNSYARLKHWETGKWVHSTSIPIDKKEAKPIMWKIGCAKLKEDNEAFQLIAVPPKEVRDLDFVNDAAKMLKIFAEKINQNYLEINERKSLCNLLAEIICFSFGKSLN